MNLSACRSEICEVDVAPLVAWLEANPQRWPEVAPTKPGRVFDMPRASQVHGVIQAVVREFPAEVTVHQPMLSRMAPGQSHPMHVDSRRSDGITRVHVPLVTNDGCWFAWEEEQHIQACDVCGSHPDEQGTMEHGEECGGLLEGMAVHHFALGRAYTFDTTRRHAFGNDGPTERVHLIFAVLRRE